MIKQSTRSSFNNLVWGTLVIVGISSCDILEKDTSPKQLDATMLAAADRPSVINLAGLSVDQRFRVTNLPDNAGGTFETLKDGQFVIFKPAASFSGEKSIDLAMEESISREGWNLRLNVKDVNSTSNCGSKSGVSGIYDYVKIRPGESVNLDLLANDVFCGVGYNGGLIHIVDSTPSSEDGVLSIGPGRMARFNYTPSPNFRGKLRIVYGLGINWLDTSSVPSDEELANNPSKYFEAYTAAIIEVEVSEE